MGFDITKGQRPSKNLSNSTEEEKKDPRYLYNSDEIILDDKPVETVVTDSNGNPMPAPRHNTLGSLSNLIEAQENAYEDYGGNRFTVGQDADPSLNESYYDKYANTYEDYQDLNEVRAREQGFWSKFGSSLGKFGVETVNTAVGNIVGLAVGAYQGIVNEYDDDPNTTFFSGMWNNSATQMQDALRKTVDEALPLYKSKKEAEMSPLRYMGTWNFWMENIASAGFTAGMLLSTALTGGMGLSSLTASLVRKAGASPNTVNTFYRLMAGIVGSASEASMEALNNYNDLKDAYTNDINNKYKEQVINVNKDIQLEAINIYNEALNNGNPIDMAAAVRQARNNHLDIISEIEANRAAELDGVEQRALSGGSMTFGLNMAILGLSNTMGTLSYLKAPSVNAERQIKKGLVQRTKEIIMPNPERPLGEGISKLEARAVALRETLSEGFEESNQKWASELAKQYYGSDYDPNSAESFSRFLEKAGESFSDTYTNAETWKEFLAGAITGAFGTFNPAGLSKLARGGATASDFWQGGIIEAWREGGKLAERSQKAYDEMNKLMTNKKLQDNFKLGVFNLASKERQMQAAARGDKFAYENENDAQTIRMVQTFANAGELTALNNLIGDNNNISDEELNALSEGLTEKNEKKYGDNKYHSDYSFLLTDNGERISDITDLNDPRRAEAKKKIKKESDRIKNIIKEYQKAVNEADARTGYSLEQKELNLIAWGLTQAKNWEERINSMRGKIGDKYNTILTKIKDKLDSYKVNLNNFEEGKNELKKEILNIDNEIRKDPDNAELKARRKEVVSALNDFSKLTKELENQQKFVEAYSNLISFLNGEAEDKNGNKLDGLSVLSATVLNNTSKTHNVYQELAKTLDDISESEVSYNDKKDFLNMLKDMNKCANAIHHVSNHMNKLMDNKDELQHTFDAFNDEFLNDRVDAYGKAYAESLKNLPAKIERDIVGEIRDNFDKIMDYYKQQYDKYIRPVEEKLNEIQQRIDEAKAITKDYAELNKLQKEKVNYERRLKVLRSFRSKFAVRIKKIKKAAENAMKDLNPESKELLDAIDETNRLLAEFLPEAIDAINSNDASFREMNTLPAIIRKEEIQFQNESDDSISKEEYIAKLLDRWQRDKQNEVFNKTKQFLFNLVFWAYKNHFTPLLLNEMEYYKIAHEIGMNISDVTDTKTLRDRVAFIIAKKILDFDRNDRKKLNPHYSPKLIAIERQKPDESLSISGTSSTTGVPLNVSDIQDVEFVEYNSDGSVKIPELDPMQDITEEEIQRSLEQEKLDFARAIVDNVLLEDKKKYVAELAAMRRRKANKEGLIDRMLQVIAEEEDMAVEELVKRARNEIKREKAKERREALKRQKEAEIVEQQKQQLRAKILAEIEGIRAEKRKLEEETKTKLKEKIQEIESMAESTKGSARESVAQSIGELETQSDNLKQQADAISSAIDEIKNEKEATVDSLKGAIDTAITAITNESDDLKESLKGSVKSVVEELRTQKEELDKKLEEAQRQESEQGDDRIIEVEAQVFDEENHMPMLAFTRSMTPMRFGSDGQMHKIEGFDNIFELQEIKDAFDFVNSGKLDKLVKENAEHNEYTEVYVQKKDEYNDIAFLYVKDNEGEYRCIGFLAKGKSYVSNNIVTEENQYQFGYWIDEEGKNHYPSIALPRKKNGERQIGNQITSIENQNGEPFRILGTLKGSETNSASFIPLTDARVGNVSIKDAFENGDITIVFVKNGSTEAIDIFNDNKISIPESAYSTIDGSSVQNFVCVYPNTDHILFRRISYNYSAINMSGMSVSDITNGDDEVLKDLIENITVIAKNLVDFVNSRRGAGSQISASDEKEFSELFYKRMQNLFIPKCAGWFPKFKVNKKTGAIFGCYANAVTTDNKTLLTLNIPLSGKSQNELVDYIVETIFNQIKQGGFRNVVTKSPNGETVIETISCFNEGTVIYIKPNINLSNKGKRNFDTYSKYFSVNPNDGNNNIGRENGNFYVGFSGTEEYHSVNPFDSYKETTGEQKKSSKISIGTANNYVFVQVDENDNANNDIVNKNGESISNDELLSITDPNNIVDDKTIASTLRNKLIGHILDKSTKITIDINDDYYFDTNTFTIQKRINKNQIDWSKEFKEATVIWAHPTAGKTTLYEKGDSRVIDFDSVAKPEIAEAFGLPKSTSAKDLSIYCTGLNTPKEIKDKYYRLLDEKLDEYTKKAKKEGKKLLVSDMRFIRNHKSDIDIVVTMSADKFAKGMAARGENRADGWKNNIDSNVAEYRNIFGKVYDMSDDEAEHFEQVLNKYTEKSPVVEDAAVVDLGDGGFGEELFREVNGTDEESLSLSIGDYTISDFISIVESIKGIDSDIVNFMRRHIGLNTKVKIVSNDDFELLKAKRKKPNATGFYNKTDDVIVVPKSASAKTLVHELVHPMTIHMLDYVFKHQEIIGNREILSAINELINEISDAYNEDPSVFAGTNIEYIFSKRGASAAKELFSEVMSDEALQNALAKVKSKSSYTLFDKIREIINDMLRIFGYNGNVRDFTSLFDRFKKIARNTEINYELANPTKGDTASRIVKEVGDDAIDFCKRLGFSTVFNTENTEVVVDFVNKVMTFPDLSDRSFNVALSKVCAVLMPDDLLQEIRKVAELNSLDASPATLSRDILKVIEGRQSDLLGNLKSKLSNHISNIFDKIFKNDNYYISLINKAVNEIIDKNSKYYNTAVKEGFELKTLDMDKLYSNEHYNIYRTLVNLGAALDGSAALRMQGTLYRSGEEDFHDLDFTMKFNNFSWQVKNAVDNLVKTYKTLTKNYLYKDKGVYKNLKKGYLDSLTAELKKTPIYKILSNEYADIRVKNFGKSDLGLMVTLEFDGYPVDIFYTKEVKKKIINGFVLADFTSAIGAKLVMGREKDIRDIINFKKYDIAEIEKQSDEELNDFCQKNGYDIDEFKKILVPLQSEIKKC